MIPAKKKISAPLIVAPHMIRRDRKDFLAEGWGMD
jgi:hypothetical protein